MSSSGRFRLSLVCAAVLAFSAAADAAQDAPTGTSAGSPSTVVAKQGDAAVTLADIDAFAQRIPEKERAGFFNDPKRLETMITQLLLEKQLAAEARKAGLENDPDVKAEVDLAETEALSKARMDRFKADLKMPDFGELAKETYIAHKENYVVPGQINVKHVLIGINDRTDAQARALAEKVRAEAVAHPDDFDALVEKYSDDPSKKSNHGLIANVTDGQFVPSFVGAAKKLRKVGEISPIVRTKYGYHVLKLVARTPDKPQTFAEVRSGIIDKLRTDFTEKAVRTHADEIRNQPIDANKDLVASLRTRYGTVPLMPEGE